MDAMHRRQELAEPKTSRMLAYSGLTAGSWTAATMLGSSLAIFLDPVSVLWVAAGAIGPVLAIHGPWEVARGLQATFAYGTRDDLSQATQLWLQAGGFAAVAGALGSIVGLVQVLQNYDGGANFGPALALALLTQLYGLGALGGCAMMALRTARRVGVAEAGGTSVVTLPALVGAAVVSLPLGLLTFGVVAVKVGGHL